MGDRITVCAGCREGAGRGLAEKLGEVVGAEVRLVGCLMACGKPVAMAVSGDGKSTYLFAGVEPEAQVDEVALLEAHLAVLQPVDLPLRGPDGRGRLLPGQPDLGP